MASAEVRLAPLKSCQTKVRAQNGKYRRGVSYSLFKYTLVHTDLAPTCLEKGYTCKVCLREDLFSATQAVFHARANHLPKFGGKVRDSAVLRDYLEPNGAVKLFDEEKRLCVDLEMFKLVAAAPGHLLEFVTPDMELAEEMMACATLEELWARADASKERLAELEEGFEDKVSEVCDKYLGTPKAAESRPTCAPSEKGAQNSI